MAELWPELEPELTLAELEPAPELVPGAEPEPEPKALPELEPEPVLSPEVEPEPLPPEPDAELLVEPERELLPVFAPRSPSPGLDPCVEAQPASRASMATADPLSEGLFILFHCYAFLTKRLEVLAYGRRSIGYVTVTLRPPSGFGK